MKAFKGYKNLRKETIRIVEGRNPKYNCAGNAVEFRANAAWWPGGVGTGRKPLQEILTMYRQKAGLNFRRAGDTESVEEGDIAVYGFSDNEVMHLGRVLPGGYVDSKLGDAERITHPRDGLNRSKYGHFLYYLKRADPQPAPRRRKGDEVEAMAVHSPGPADAPTGESATIVGYVIDGPDRYALHVYFDCPALERSDLPLDELDVPDTGDLVAAAAGLGLDACRVCLDKLSREPLGEFEVQGGGFWPGGQFFLLIYPDRVELIKVASGLAQALGIGAEWRDIRIGVDRIVLVQPKGGGLLSALSPPTLRIETDDEADWIECTFAETEARDVAFEILRQVMGATG